MARRKPVDALRAEVARLRDDGLSFSQVAATLKISKAYTAKRSEPVTDGHHNRTSVEGVTAVPVTEAPKLDSGSSQRGSSKESPTGRQP